MKRASNFWSIVRRGLSPAGQGTDDAAVRVWFQPVGSDRSRVMPARGVWPWAGQLGYAHLGQGRGRVGPDHRQVGKALAELVST